MQIVTDSAADLSPEQLEGLDIHFAGLKITLDGKTYESGVDLDPITFYQLLAKTDSYPTTSQPSAGDFADMYRKLAQTDPEILSVHISSGLSGTCNAARLGAEMVPEAKVTLWDSKTLSCPLGWQVEEAARMVQAGAKMNDILTRLAELREKVEAMYTLDTLKYLIHGGRINHITGLLASMLNIKPIIGVEKELGKYVQLAKHITIKRSIQGMADLVAGWYGAGSKLRVQLLHGNNMEGVEIFREILGRMFECQWMTTTPIAPVLGAHTGPGMVGLAVSPMSLFEG